MGDITSLKVRLARLRLAGSKDVAERIRNRRKPIEEEEEPQTRKANEDYQSRVENEIKNTVGQSEYTGVNGKDRVFRYLSDLQESGETNMFGAGPYVKQEFPDLDNSQVKEVVSEWMKNRSAIHKRLGIGMKRGKKTQKKAAQDPYNQYTKNTGGKRKKVNKLTRSDQKRGSLDAGYGDYVENTGGKRKKKNKLTRSDQKRGKKVIKKKKIKLDADDYVRSHTPSNVIKQGPDYYPDST